MSGKALSEFSREQLEYIRKLVQERLTLAQEEVTKNFKPKSPRQKEILEQAKARIVSNLFLIEIIDDKIRRVKDG